jgi:hypothetical protein
MDNLDGNLLTSILEVLITLRNENLKVFMIIEPAWGSHENPSSSNLKMPN